MGKSLEGVWSDFFILAKKLEELGNLTDVWEWFCDDINAIFNSPDTWETVRALNEEGGLPLSKAMAKIFPNEVALSVAETENLGAEELAETFRRLGKQFS